MTDAEMIEAVGKVEDYLLSITTKREEAYEILINLLAAQAIANDRTEVLPGISVIIPDDYTTITKLFDSAYNFFLANPEAIQEEELIVIEDD